MKKYSIIYCMVLLVTVVTTGCVKVIDKFNSNNITVTFNSPGPFYLTGDKTLNSKDSIKFSYSVSSTKPMTLVYLLKNETPIFTDTVKTGDKLSFTGLKKLVADTIPGNYVYKVVAKDNNNVYVGASSTITVTVLPNFTYYTNKRLYVPDTAAKTNKTYYNLTTQTAYSYSDIIANKNSADVDFGFFYDPAIATGTTPKGISLYNLASTFTTSAIGFYDLSSFTTKNATLFAKYTAATWPNVNSAGLIKAACATAFKTPTSAMYYLPSLAAGNIILFKTASGKVGALTILYISVNNAGVTTSGPSTYINFEVKMPN